MISKDRIIHFFVGAMTFLVLTFLSSAIFAQEPATGKKPNYEIKEVEVVIGIDKIEKLDFVPNPRIKATGEGSTISYTLIPQKKQIIFTGLKPGKASATIWDTVNNDIRLQYEITVTSHSQSKVVRELQEFIGDVEGLEIGIKGDKVYVGGKIVVPTDIGRVAVVLDNYKEVIRMVELSPHTQRIIAKKMQDEIHKSGMNNVTVRVINGSFWLEGTVDSAGKKKYAEDIAIAYLPDKLESLAHQTGSVVGAPGQNPIHNFLTVDAKSSPAPVPKLIKVTAQFVELTKAYAKIFSFQWMPLRTGDGGSISINKGAGGVSTSSSNTLTATISNLFPKLLSAKNAGYARIIQSGVVVTKDKVKAKVEKNSTRRFEIGTGENMKSGEAVAGFNLDVTPTILQEEKIDLNLGVSISSNVGSPPETLKNKISTALVVKSKESAVVGGIVIAKNSTDFDRPSNDKADDDSSPLFNFYRSKEHRSDKSQFVVFVTPEIIESASAGTNEIKRKFRRRRK